MAEKISSVEMAQLVGPAFVRLTSEPALVLETQAGCAKVPGLILGFGVLDLASGDQGAD
jgi:hypothetical protein